MKNNLSVIILLFISSIVFAGNGNDSKVDVNTRLISGKVIDKKSGEEIAGAEIKINDKIIYSDMNGNFSANIDAVKTEAEIKFISYNDTKINIDPFSYKEIVVELESK